MLTYTLAIAASGIVIGLALLESAAPRFWRFLEYGVAGITSVIAILSIRTFLTSGDINVARRHVLVITLVAIEVWVYLLFLHGS